MMKLDCFKFLLFAGSLLLVGFLQSCSEEGSSSPSHEDTVVFVPSDSLMGMIKVLASGKSTILGTNSEKAKASDRPQMEVLFGYDFFMSSHEVTCGEFNKLMKSETGLTDSCDKDSLPVANVSYYDAVLFANARSKAEGMDTAYTYAKASFDENRNCIGLEKLNFSTNIEGYRLPSEAEWVFVAQDGWNAENSWHNGNSDYERHNVCSKKTKDQLFCDMAGNVMEWTNDWLGTLLDTTISNYMGAPDGGSIGERVVKGGSFTNDVKAINWYSRGDVYTVTSATKAKYVGFRLALGKVKEPSWMKGDGTIGDSRISVLTSVSEMKSLLGTYSSKLAFRNDLTGNIAFVNFAGGSLSVIEIQDSLDCFHPEISPDGQKVAFSTKYEGVSGKSAVYVRNLNAAGSNLVKLDVESAAIPRWRILESGDTAIVYVTDAGSNKEDGDFKSAETWQVVFVGGKFGTPEKLFSGNYHGGISRDGSLAVSGARLLRVNLDGVEDLWYNGEQACNVSLSPVKKQTLFLDFGGKTGREFVGTKYGTHERLLVMDSTGNLIQTVASPKGFAFDHSEWNVGDVENGMVVASLTNSEGAHQKIALIHLQDSSVTEVLEGEELWHPNLWVGKKLDVEDDSLDLDSAGVYFTEGSDWIHELVRLKMEMLWTKRDSIEILAVGSSRVEEGIIPNEMSSGLCLNMGHPGNDMYASLYIAENYGFNHLQKLKAVIVSLDLDLWVNQDRQSKHLFGTVPGYIYDANHHFWKSHLPENFVKAVENAYPASPLAEWAYVPSLGYIRNEAVAWGNADIEEDSTWSSKRPEIIPWNLELLESFVQKAYEHGIVVVGVIFPQNPGYRNTGSWGRYGPTRSDAEMAVDSLNAMTKRYKNLFIMDENKMGHHDYDDSMALNTDHLGYAGASKMTSRVDSLLKKVLD